MSYSINTPRLICRTAIKADAAFLLQLHSDPADAEMGVFRESQNTVAQYEQKVVDWQDTAAEGKNRFMVIVVKPSTPGFDALDAPTSHDGKLIGMTGFNVISYAPGQERPHLDRGSAVDEIDVGVFILPSAGGWGWGKEALAAVVDYAFELGSKSILMETSAINTKFIAFCAKIGLGEYSTTKVHEERGEERIYRFDREAWERSKKNWPVYTK